ncbi:MAG: penicillin-binding protein 2 [Winogradskyella sp.]|uniref:penicillin-binding protein 2 n=1 Tax=Winogradskyella sp. TaxID=1883156 RepID=UPI00185456BE|nr:penicillin-binding protein 2 [Winogradskyella sp.]MBT8244510.1 penicillin-binding protein 2 [Winogradskyella sp.]NNK23952.1 penicillin-binding protein 2 [Winogradskyella sp.]
MRKLLLLGLVTLVGFVFIARLYYLQVHDAVKYSPLNDSAIKKEFTYPKRGYVYDRNGELLVANQPSYDVMVIPREVKPLDTLEFCALLKITKEDFLKTYDRAYKYSPRLPYVFLSNLSKDDYAVLQEKMRKYDGFYIQKRSIRTYRKSIGANVLGDIGEVNNIDIKNDAYYSKGDLIGKQGVEKTYEKTLRGVKGTKFIQKDRFNRDLGPFENGKFDTIAKPGKDITITIDSKLQEYGELLMTNKRGGIIAIEPSSGEILAMIAGPNYDPNLLVGRNRSDNYNKLYNDSLAKPLFNRSLQGVYEPGSPFKLMNALIGLQEGVISNEEKITCYAGYKYANRFMKCHCSIGRRNNLINGIQESCNAYFATTYRRILEKPENAREGIELWSKHAKSFGLGNYLNNDLAVGQKGRIPDRAYYKRVYPERFYSTYTISNAIGQGEVATTPIQLANMTAAIANRGYYYTPHIIKNIEGESIHERFTTPKQTTINKQHFQPVIEGMLQVYKKGTAKYLQIDGIEICGKTGTVENFIKVDSTRMQLTDHSIFVAFAPKDDPKIAIAVFVENGYFGNRFAGKMASLMIEKYLKNKISRTDLEHYVLRHTLEHEYEKPYSGKPFKINRETTLETVSDEEFEKLNYLKAQIDSR